MSIMNSLSYLFPIPCLFILLRIDGWYVLPRFLQSIVSSTCSILGSPVMPGPLSICGDCSGRAVLAKRSRCKAVCEGGKALLAGPTDCLWASIHSCACTPAVPVKCVQRSVSAYAFRC